MKKKRIWMGQLTTRDICAAQIYTLREIERKYGDYLELVYPPTLWHRMFHDAARNAAVEEFLDSDCDAIWFLDSDIAPPVHVAELIVNHWDKWEAAGAPYPVFMKPPGEETQAVVYTIYKGSNGKALGTAQLPKDGTDWLDGVGTGCMLLKRSVFDKLERPWFEFKYDEESRTLKVGEDLGFCLKLNALNIQFFTDYSMVCKHFKNVCLLDINNYAIDYANRAVMNYDAFIKTQVTDAVKVAYQKGKDSVEKSDPAPRRSSYTGLILPPGY